LIAADVNLLVYGLALAAVVLLVWPGSKASQALASVAGGLSATLRGGVA
jgi:hypothetical protein